MGAKRTSETEMARAVTTGVALIIRATGNKPEHVLERIGPKGGFVDQMVQKQFANNRALQAQAEKEGSACQ